MHRACAYVLLIASLPLCAQTPPPAQAPAETSPPQIGVLCNGSRSVATNRRHPQCKLPPGDQKRAQQDYDRGLKARAAGDFQSAIEHFKNAAALAPRDINYLTAVETARQQFALKNLDDGNAALLKGNRVEALAAFRTATEIDPANEFAKQRLRDALPPLAVVKPEPSPVEFDGLIDLRPDPGKHSIHFRGNSPQLLEQLARTYGLTAFMDESVTSRQVRVELDDATWEQAVQVIGKMTKTFWTPLAPNQVLFAADNEQTRRILLRAGLRSFYISQGATQQEMNDLANVLRVLFDLRFVVVSASTGTITVRGPQQVLEAATAFMEQLENTRPQVMLDIQVFELDSTLTTAVGVNIPDNFQIFNVPTEAQKLLGGMSISDVVKQINSGNISAALAGVLAQALSQGTSPLSQPFATFGGGITLMGLNVPSLSAALSRNTSAVRSLQHMTLRAAQGTPAVLKLGVRYPIVTASAGAAFAVPKQFSSSVANTISAPVPTFTYEDVGISVKTTPTVHRAGDVQLDLEMQIRAIGAQTSVGAPIISNREYKGVITAKDGDTIVIAGSLSHSESLGLQGIPLLSRLPFSSRAFSQQSKQSDNHEILIIVSPHVTSGLNPTATNPIPIPDYIPR